ESVLSALLAPVMMVIQSVAVQNILIGRDSGWGNQRRADGTIPFAEIVRRHRYHSLFGVALGISAYLVSPALLAWMSPAVLGLVIAIPLSAATSSRKFGLALRRLGLLMIPEEHEEPTIHVAARRAAGEFTELLAASNRGCLRLGADPALLAFHRKNLPPRAPESARTIDGALVVGTARVAVASSLDEALDALAQHEKLAVYSDPTSFDRLAQLPRRHATPLVSAARLADDARREAAA
ncbi:MAG TPA: glucan biosynthesis glucosyltransferase H, partial [Saliniramus sp.]|nr:glucan biosynthesis glucosyltransferase H [Saliniramus sp.]